MNDYANEVLTGHGRRDTLRASALEQLETLAQ
jgi:RHS repeat-associated protein